MVRTIKFRAWNGIKMKYDVSPIDNERYIVFETKQKSAKDLHINRGKIMQYTGLKDKNDIEVYEGDVLSHKYLDKKRIEQRATTVMEYEDNQYDYGGRCMGFDVNGFWGNNFEVIGNIYENPELLE